MLTVGQTLWYVRNSYNRPGPQPGQEVRVDKVGRKWADISGTVGIGLQVRRFNMGRINIKTLVADGGKYPSDAQAYLSREHYERRLRVSRVFRELRQRMNDPMPGVTEEGIRAAARALQIELPPIEEPEQKATNNGN